MQGGCHVKIAVHNTCPDFNTYRVARVKSLFNAESGATFDVEADLPVEDSSWRIGVVVGPSGSGKTTIGRAIWGGEHLYADPQWPADQAIVEAIDPEGDFNDVTSALAAVGLGTVPSWLRPYHVLSMGERFRADLARIIAEAPPRIVIDEFTSVVDRQIAKVGAGAFAKAWRRTAGQAVILTCHYDVLDWLEPDWVYDTGSGKFSRGSLWQRPRLVLDIFQTNASYWPRFAPHYYLTLPRLVAANYYVGVIDGEPVAHLATSPRLEIGGLRASRMVVMPEWQGAGVGLRFLNAVCQWCCAGNTQYGERVKRVYFHTSHPGLAAGLRRDKRWTQVSAQLHGGNKRKSASHSGVMSGYGGHWRAVQGFKFAP